MSDLGFIDLDEVQENDGDFAPLPAGEYSVLIESAEVKPNAQGTGKILKVGYKVEGPKMVGRFIWDNLNIEHHNATAQNIARAEFKQLALACGFAQCHDSQMLLGKRINVKVAIEKRRDTGEDVNRIKRRTPLGAAPTQAPKGDPLAPPTSSNGGGIM